MKPSIRSAYALAGLLIALSAQAEYPDRVIKIVVPFAAGGIDSAARGLANGLSKTLGKPFVVESKPGGNTIIGAQAVANSPPDGYTFLFTSGATVAVIPHLVKSQSFDPGKAFASVGKVARLPFILVVHPDLKVNNLKEFIALAKASPGKYSYASAGAGTGGHIGFELLKYKAGINLAHVPYKATSQAMPDLLTGRVSAMMADPMTIKSAVSTGALRALAATTRERAAGYPTVPSVAEQGIDNFDLEIWMGLFAPLNTPAATITTINTAMRKFLTSPEGSVAFDNVGFTANVSSPEELTALVAKESAIWAELAATGVLKID